MGLGRMRRGRWFARLLAMVLAVPLTWIGWNQATYNFAVLQPGRIYRSGQMFPSALLRTLREHEVKTVLNLRGPNPRESWYRDEIATTLAAGATQVDLPLSSCVWMSRIQLRTFIRVLDTCEYPVLLHCAWGSERTGLAAAIAELLCAGSTLADARRQLALRYLYVRLGDGRIMAEFLDQYENWLRAKNLEHRPEVFRTWVEDGYLPGKPNREEWPYDPSPLVIVTQPSPRPPERDLAGRERSMIGPETINR
jgi:hypothetical protein